MLILLSIVMLLLGGRLAHADLRTSNIPGIPAGKVGVNNWDGCVQVNAEDGRKFGCSADFNWNEANKVLTANGTINSPSVSEKDAIHVNGVPATDLNILNTTATTADAATTWTLSAVPNPDTVALAIAPATDVTAGIITATDQSFGGTKTFGNGGIELAPKAEDDETPLCIEGKIGVKVAVANNTLIACVEGEEIDLIALTSGLEGARSADRSFRGAISENSAVEFCPDVETGDTRCGKYWVSSMGMQEHKPGARLEYISSDAPLVILDRATSVVRFVLRSNGTMQFGDSGPCIAASGATLYQDADCDNVQDAGENALANP